MSQSIRRYGFWFIYLGMTWAIVAFVPEYLLVAPLCLVGLFWRPAWGLATRINRWVFVWVMNLQPWWKAQIHMSLPEDVENLKNGCLLVSNHRSHMDAFIILRSFSHVRLVAKTLIFLMPTFGHMLWLLQMIPVRRQSTKSYWKAMEKVKRGLSRGDRIHIFPEMTRSEEGQVKLGRFHLAPFKVAMEARVLIVPIVFWGTDAAWPKGSFKMAYRQPAIAKTLDPVDGSQFSSAQELSLYVQDCIQQEVYRLAGRTG